MPNEPAGDPGNRESTIADLAEAASSAGRRGAWPWNGRGTPLRRGRLRVTLVARSTDRLAGLAGSLADTGAEISTIAADASDPDGLGRPDEGALPRTRRTGRHRL